MQEITFTYSNHRGEVEKRTIIPHKLEYMPKPGFGYEPGWFLTGYCKGRKALRSFALTNIQLNAEEPYVLVYTNCRST